MTDRIIDRRKNWEARAEMAILERPSEELCTYDKMLYVALCGFASHNGMAFPSVARLAQIVSCSERSIYKSLDKLEEVALVVRHHQFGKNGGQKVTLYEIFGSESYTPLHDMQSPPAPRSDITSPYEQKDTIPLRELAMACAAAQNTPPSVEVKPEVVVQESEREIYPASKAPEAMIQTAAYLLLQTGRSKLSSAEIDALMKLDANHYPSFVQKHIDELVERFKKSDRALRTLNFCYVLASLKNFSPTLDCKKNRTMPSQNLVNLDEYAFLESDEYRQQQLGMLRAEGYDV